MAELFFADFCFDTRRLALTGPDGALEVRAKTLELLTYLIQNRNRFVPRDELMQHLWPDVTVTASSLTQCVSELRQALSDSAREPLFIETRIKLGYRFVATVYHRPTERLEPLPPPPDVVPTTLRRPGVRMRRRRLMIGAVVLLTSAVLWWWTVRPEALGPPVVVVAPVSGSDLDPGARRIADSARFQILDNLTRIEGITVSAVSTVKPRSRGFAVEHSCWARDDGSAELSVSLRVLPGGEAVWGWTWVVPRGSEAAPAEIADRLVEAVEARLHGR